MDWLLIISCIAFGWIIGDAIRPAVMNWLVNRIASYRKEKK